MLSDLRTNTVTISISGASSKAFNTSFPTKPEAPSRVACLWGMSIGFCMVFYRMLVLLAKLTEI
jgi:hypothetical protein